MNLNELTEEQKEIIKTWQESFLGKALSQHVSDSFKSNEILAALPAEIQEQLVNDFYKRIFELSKSEKPLLTLRGYIASYVHAYATFQVLALTEKEKASSFFKGSPYISAQLYKHISELVKHNEEFKALGLHESGISDQELLAFCRRKAAIGMFYMNGMNIVRCEMRDMDSEKDWLRPFIESMLITEEQQCRSAIGLPSLLSDDEFKHRASFLNYVTDGTRNPLQAWEQASTS